MTDVRGRQQASRDSLFEKIEPSSAWTEDPNFHYLLVDTPGFKKEWLKLQVLDLGYILVGGEKQTENKIIHFEQRFKLPENSDAEKISGRYEGEILYVVVPKLVKDGEREPLNASTDDKIRGKKHEHEGDQEEHDEKHEHYQEHDKKHEHHQEERDRKHELHQQEHGARHRHEHDEEEHVYGGPISHRGQIDEDRMEEIDEDRMEDGILGSVKEILRKNKGIVVTAVVAFTLGVFSQKFQSNAGSKGSLPPISHIACSHFIILFLYRHASTMILNGCRCGILHRLGKVVSSFNPAAKKKRLCWC